VAVDRGKLFLEGFVEDLVAPLAQEHEESFARLRSPITFRSSEEGSMG
jgi:hypothetical protein